MSVEENKRVLVEFDQLMGAEDLTPLDRLCRPEMVNHAIASGRPAGLAGTREFLETMGRHQMSNEGWRELVVVADTATTSCSTAFAAVAGMADDSSALRVRLATTAGGLPPYTGSRAVGSRSAGRCATT